MLKHTKFIRGRLPIIAALMIFCSLIMVFGQDSFAAVETVTIKYGSVEYYGEGHFHTLRRWVTHINGEAVDLDDEPGVTRSYAYCVQPSLSQPDAGTYKVTVVDDDDTGKVKTMRKLIYYLPGAYGYTSVTKKRWFSSQIENSSDYAVGHVALSYIYDNYSDTTDAWKGTGDKIKKRVKYMLSDLKNLPDPPESFEIFWIKVKGKQDTLGAIYATEYGKACVRKLSSDTVMTDGNDCYTLAGAQYTVFTDCACTEVAKTRDGGTAVMTIATDGNSDVVELETGSYYIKETTAPRGYAMDTEVHSIQITRDSKMTYTAHDTPKSNPVDALIQKVDAETGLARPQGKASLKDAEFTIRYYDVYPKKSMSESELRDAISDKDVGTINGKKCEWVYKTDETGLIDFSCPESYMIKDRSAELFRDSKGSVVMPIGIITIQETKAPKGYNLNETVFIRAIYENGTTESVNTLQTLTEENSVKEQVYRADICFSKSSDGLKRMKYVPFKITSLTTGESHIVVTDENGYANTSSCWNKHDVDTNKGKTDEDGIWFNGYNDDKTGAVAQNKLAALPYDTYEIEELRCESNKGHDLIKDTITIKRNGVLIDMGTFDDKPIEIEESKVPEIIPAPEPAPVAVVSKVVKKITSPETGDENQDAIFYLGLFIAALVGAMLLTARIKGGRLKSGERYSCKH